MGLTSLKVNTLRDVKGTKKTNDTHLIADNADTITDWRITDLAVQHGLGLLS